MLTMLCSLSGLFRWQKHRLKHPFKIAWMRSIYHPLPCLEPVLPCWKDVCVYPQRGSEKPEMSKKGGTLLWNFPPPTSLPIHKIIIFSNTRLLRRNSGIIIFSIWFLWYNIAYQVLDKVATIPRMDYKANIE